tara:strand:- start:729 stop:1013 length:285 start_codon:yes stop_codon:yes gene_type:complete
MTGHILKFMQEVGIPITVALGVGWFLFIILKFILAQVEERIRGVAKAIGGLENKVEIMNNDIVKIDTLISGAFNTEPNLNRIAASDGKSDARDN